MNASGVWRGFLNGRMGHFKFINVEVLPDQKMKPNNKLGRNSRNSCPATVDELLLRIGLKEYTSVFVLNGWVINFSLWKESWINTKIFCFSSFFLHSYEELELFKELEPSDLDYLGIVNAEHRAKLLAAVQLLHDLDSATSDGDIAGSSSENDDGQRLNHINKKNSLSPFGRRHFPRDSGCYEGSPLPSVNQNPNIIHSDDPNSLDNLDSVVTQCSNEILKRVENARRMKDDSTPKSISRLTKKGLLGGAGVDDLCSRGGGALSEKSSDSGVSSSSLSSGPMKNNL